MAGRTQTTALLAWGRRPMAVDLEGWDVEMIEPGAQGTALDDPARAVLEALDSPEGLEGFDEWIRGASSVAIVVDGSDAALPWPGLPALLLERAVEAGVEPGGLNVVLATGGYGFRGWKGHPHAWLTDLEGVEVVVHDPADPGCLEPLGEVGRSGARSVAEGLLGEVVRIAGGQPPSPGRARAMASAGRRRVLMLNRAVTRADRIIAVSTVVPHPLFGFTGGGQPLLPGAAGKESVRANEDLGLLPTAGPGRVEGNPALAEVEEAARLLGDSVLCVDAVPAPAGGVLGFAAGRPWLVPRVTTPLALEAFGASCRPAPSVLVSARSATLEALVRAAAVASPAVQTSGTLLVACECAGGPGDPERVGRIYEAILEPRLAGASILVHTALEPREVLGCGLRPVRSIAAGLEVMRDRAGGDGRIAVIADGSATLPRV